MYQKSFQEEKQQHKIFFYIGNLVRGGAQRVVVNLANYFVQEGYRVFLVTAKKEAEEYCYDDRVERIISDLDPEEESKSRILNFCRRIYKMRKVWKEKNPSIIISFMGKSNLFTILSSMGLHIPVLVSVRSAPEREYRGLVIKILSKTLFAAASGLILQTEEALQFFPGYIRKKAVILPNSIDTHYIKPRCSREERRNEIVAVGSIDANKNHEMLIDAFAVISEKYPEMKLIIYGEGVLREHLQEKTQRINLEQRIFLPGREYEIYNKIWNSRIFVLSSYAEGMPNALIEAMVMGLAVVSTDCDGGGPGMLIQNGKNGLLIPTGDKEALVKALEMILDNAELEETLGEEAYELRDRLIPEKVNQIWQDYITSFFKSSL